MLPLRRRSLVAGTAAMLAMPAIGRAAGPTVLRASTPDAEDHPDIAVLQQFAKLVSDKTSGALVVKIFPNSTLVDQANAITGMQMGSVDFAITPPAQWEGQVPRLGVMNLPFIFSNEKAAEKVMDGDVGQSLSKDMTSKGIYVLAWSTWGWRVTETSGKSIRHPADFKGLRMRLPPGPVFADTFKTLGAIPTVVDATELYVAISQGTVDAFDVPLLSLVASKWYEVTKTVSLTNHSYNPVWLAGSKRKLDALPADQRKAIMDAAAEVQTPWRKSIAEKSLDAQKFVASRNITVVTDTDFKAFQDAMAVVYKDFRDKIGGPLIDQVMHETST